MDKLANLRYYFEIISIPIFAYFVIHLVGHGFLSLQDVHHTHAHHGDHATFFSPDFFAGVAGLVVFTAIWNLKFMKKFVPCSHDHCHHVQIVSHLLATTAFVFHFFPESVVRHKILANFDWHNIENIAGFIGFFSHFIIDIVLMIMLSSFWKKTWQKAISMIIIIAIWFFAFYIGKNGGLALTGVSKPIILIFSGFLLSMFIHKPHKPKVACNNECKH